MLIDLAEACAAARLRLERGEERELAHGLLAAERLEASQPQAAMMRQGEMYPLVAEGVNGDRTLSRLHRTFIPVPGGVIRPVNRCWRRHANTGRAVTSCTRPSARFCRLSAKPASRPYPRRCLTPSSSNRSRFSARDAPKPLAATIASTVARNAARGCRLPQNSGPPRTAGNP